MFSPINLTYEVLFKVHMMSQFFYIKTIVALLEG